MLQVGATGMEEEEEKEEEDNKLQIITAAARSNPCTVFHCSKTGIMF
jgi:hypothetical protein